MAVNIGPRIGIDGEAEYRKQINNIIQQTKTLNAEMKSLEASFGKEATAQEKAAARSKNLVQSIDAQKKHIEQCKDMLAKASEQYDENDTKVLKWKQALAEGEAQLEKLYAELKNNSPIKALGDSLEQVGNKMKTVGDTMQNVGQKLTTSVTLPIVAIGTASAKLAMDFEAGMSKVAAISGATGSELADLSKKAQEMGAKTKFSATESAEAFSYMAMAGWKAADMLDGIEGIMNLAAASGEDLAMVSDIVTDDLTAFGLAAKDTGRFVDVLAAASSNSNTNVAMMGETFQYAGSVAGALGYSIEDVALATGLMANSGIKASNAGTALRSVLTRMAKPTKESQVAMDKLNLSIVNDDGSMRSLYDVVVDMRAGFAGMTAEEKASTAAMLAGKNAMSGLLAIVNASDADFKKLGDSIAHSTGAAQMMADIMEDNAKGSLTRMKSALEGAGIAAGQAFVPYITKAAESVQRMAEQFTALSPKQQESIIKWAALAAAIGPVTTIAGKLVSTAGDLTLGLSKVIMKIAEATTGEGAYAIATGAATAAQEAFNVALTANPVGVVLAGVALLAGGMIALSEAFGTAEKEVDETAESLKSLKKIATDATDSLSGGMDSIKDSVDGMMDSAEGTAKHANELVNELLRLEKQSKKTAKEQERMAFIVDQLNTIYPDLGLEIEDVSGKLNKGAGELRAYINNVKELAMADAYFNAMSAGYTKVAEAEREVTQAETELNNLIDRGNELKNESAIISGRLYQANKETGESFGYINGECVDFAEQLANVNNEIAENQKAQEEAQVIIDDLKGKMAEAETEVENYANAYEATTAKTNEYEAAAEKAAEATGNMSGTAEAGVKSFDDLSYAQQQTAIAFAEQVNNLTQATVEAINSQMNMFEEFKRGSDISTETLLKNMQSQIDGVQKWEEDLSNLADRGINQNLLGYLASMGPQGQNYVSAFAGMTDEEFKKANDLWEESLDIKSMTDKWGQELLDSGIDNISKAFDGIDQAVQDAGANTARGLAEGILREAGASKDAAEEMGLEVVDAVNIALGVHSPSYKTRQAGMYLDEGLALGMRDGLGSVKTAANEIMNVVQSALLNALTGVKMQVRMQGQQTAIALSDGMKAGHYYVESAAKSTGDLVKNIYMAALAIVPDIKKSGSDAAEGLKAGMESKRTAVAAAADTTGKQVAIISKIVNGYRPQIYSAGVNVAQGLADGIKAGQSTVIKAATEVAQAAIKAAKKELGIESPSKVFYEIGDYTIKGYVNALEDGRSTVSSALNGAFDLPIAAYPSAVSGAGNVSNSNTNYEGNTIVVYGAPGQDVDELAEIIEEKLNFNYQRQIAVTA